jgi:hypothetical protein
MITVGQVVQTYPRAGRDDCEQCDFKCGGRWGQVTEADAGLYTVHFGITDCSFGVGELEPMASPRPSRSARGRRSR